MGITQPSAALAPLRPGLAAFSLVLCWLAGCGTTEGPLLRARDAGPFLVTDAGLPLTAAGGSGTPDLRVRPGMRLQYQISGTLELEVAADVYVIDLFDTRREQVAALHASGRVALAYFSAGSFEPWRADADDFPAAALGESLQGYPDERWLDPRSAQVRALMRARMVQARDKGFDGVLPGSLGAYRAASSFPLSEANQLDYDAFLAREARALGLTCGLSGDFALAAGLEPVYDWAIGFGCLAADDCERLTPFVERGKAVFDLETSGEPGALCPRAQALGISAAWKRASYDAWSAGCP